MSNSVVLAQDAPGSRQNQAMVCLGGEGVTSDHLQQNVITDPLSRKVIAAAMRGEQPSPASFDDILTRESNVNTVLCAWAGVKFPGTEVIEAALRQAEKAWGGLTIHDRFFPKMEMAEIWEAIYGFNRFSQEERGNPGFKLYLKMNEEWWRTDKGVEQLPTEMGVIRLDFRDAMQPTNMAGAPYGLDQAAQEVWAQPDSLTSAEETSLLQLRSGYEFGRPLWGYGWARCRNACGSDDSLGVGWDASGGLRVDGIDRGAGFSIGALRRKYLVLGS